jgi:hypothetical protein
MLSETIIFAVIIIILTPLFIGSIYVEFYLPFIKQIKIIKLEIKRSEGEERVYWQKELMCFYIRCIPFVGERLYRRLKK